MTASNKWVKSDPPKCFYCGALCSEGNREEDHFPFPKSIGAELTVTTCRACHDLKDRYQLDQWPAEYWGGIMRDWPLLSRESRLWLAKAARIFSEILAEEDTESPPAFVREAEAVADPDLAEWWEQQCREHQKDLDRALAAAKPGIDTSESCDRTWEHIRQFLDAEPGMATSNPGSVGAGSHTPDPCLTAQPPLPGGRVPAGGEVGR